MRRVKLPKENTYAIPKGSRSGRALRPVKISKKFYDFQGIDDVRNVEFNYTRG